MPTPSEFELIERILARLPSSADRLRLPAGDDTAVVGARGATATSIDSIVEGIHFERPAFSAQAIGRKGLAVALSDLAAMGAEPGEAYIALGAPADTPEDELLELADGIAEVAEREGVVIAGGDLTASPVLFMAISVTGTEPRGGRLVERSGARVGDIVAVTGELGGAAAALHLLLEEGGAEDRPALDPEVRDGLLARQLDPRPRLAAGTALAAAGASALIDVSDGVAGDAARLAESSGVALEIEAARLPVQEGVASVAGAEEAGRLMALSGGEDYELLVCLAAEALAEASRAVRSLGLALTEVGGVYEGAGARAVAADGTAIAAGGFDHRRPAPGP